MLFLRPNQQCQSTEVSVLCYASLLILRNPCYSLCDVLTLQPHVDISAYTLERTLLMEQRSAMSTADGDCLTLTVSATPTRCFAWKIVRWPSTDCLLLETTAIYASAAPQDGTRGVMFSGCPLMCACVRACVDIRVYRACDARAKAFSDRLAVDL